MRLITRPAGERAATLAEGIGPVNAHATATRRSSRPAAACAPGLNKGHRRRNGNVLGDVLQSELAVRGLAAVYAGRVLAADLVTAGTYYERAGGVSSVP